MSEAGKIVVLGANGFVGKSLSKYLTGKKLELSSKDLDLLDAQSTKKLCEIIQPNDRIIFISALTPDRGRGSDTMVNNIIMAQTVCAALNTVSCKQLVYISSDAVYDDRLSLVREDSACDPQSFHGVMHITREKMLLELAKRRSIPLLRLRPSAIYGAGDTHNSYGPNRFLRTFKEGGSISLAGEGEEQRDHLYIEDFCRTIQYGIENNVEGVYNVATGAALSFLEVARTISDVMSLSDVIKFAPRTSPITHKHFDMTQFHAMFTGISFTPFKKGIEETVKAEGK